MPFHESPAQYLSILRISPEFGQNKKGRRERKKKQIELYKNRMFNWKICLDCLFIACWFVIIRYHNDNGMACECSVIFGFNFNQIRGLCVYRKQWRWPAYGIHESIFVFIDANKWCSMENVCMAICMEPLFNFNSKSNRNLLNSELAPIRKIMMKTFSRSKSQHLPQQMDNKC